MKRFILLLIVFLAGAFLPAQAPPPTTPAPAPVPAGDLPEAVVLQDSYDAGNILKGKKIEHAFIIKNTGKAELTILSAKPG